MDNYFSDKTVLIVGGAQGCGKAMAMVFANRGCRVVIADIEQQLGLKTKDVIVKHGGDCIFFATDVRQEQSVQHMMERAINYYGRIDFAINCALAESMQRITDVKVEECELQLDTNVKGLILCLKHQICHMQDNKFGRIVNMSSVTGPVVGITGQGVYAATKAAIVALTKTAALETAKQGITVNAICPAGFYTGCFERYVQRLQLSVDEMKNLFPVGRVGRPNELAEMALFLCSEHASFITGQMLVADGGMTAGMIVE